MSNLSKKEESLLRDKIAIWSRHQETDKFNYNDAALKLFSSLAIIIALITILFQAINIFITKDALQNLEVALLVLAIILYFVYSYRMKVANRHFMTRENMIDDWYLILGVDKKELNEEFTRRYKKPCILF